jgi:capsular exopolysaccharide synthesis family protein
MAVNKQTRFNLTGSMPFFGGMTGTPGQDNLVDIRSLLSALRKRFWLALMAFLITFAAVTAWTLQKTPVYTAQTRLLLNTQDQNTFDFGSALSGLAPNTASIDTELEVIRSEAMLSKVVDKMNLTNYPEFNYTLQEPSGFAKFRENARDWVKGFFAGGDAQASELSVPNDAEQKAAIRNYATWRLKEAISVDRLGPAYIIDISAYSQNPELAARIADTVADQYIVEQLEAKLESTRRANEWLSTRLGALKDEVNEKESAVEAYRAESGLLSAQGSTLTEQQIADLTAQRSVRQAELQEAEARLSNVRSRLASGAGADSIAEVLGSPVIGQLRAQQADIQRRRADLLTKYGPRHPDVMRVNNELADTRRQIDAEVDKVVSNLESEVAIARQSVQSFDRSLAQARGQLAANNRATVRLRELEREAEASRTLYEDFLERFKETNESNDLAQPDARILTSASVPNSPSAPKTTVNLILGVFFGGAVAGALVLLSELRENHFLTGDEIERAFGVPSIGSIPLLTGRGRKNPGDYAIENPLSAFSESIRNLRASIVFADLDNPAKTVAICSSLPNEGKTMTTFALGRLSALSGSRTLIIDGDFRRRQLTEATDIEPDVGLIEHLFGEVALEDAMQVDDATGMHILPLTSTRNTPRDVFGSRSFDALLQRLEGMYDLIVVDTGPLLLMAESRVIVSKVDQVIVVAKWRATTRVALGQTLAILQQFNASLAGVVLNFVDLRKRRLLGQSSASYKAYSKYYSEGRPE